MSDGRIVIDVDLDDKKATKTLITLDDQFDRIEESVEDATDEIKKMNRQIHALPDRKEIDVHVDTDSISKLRVALMALSPAALPLGALVGAVGGLASAFGAAGIGVAAFGAVATTTLGKVFEATKDGKLELQGLTKAQQEAAKALHQFKKFWGSFAKSFESPIIDLFIDSLRVLKVVINNLKPAIDGSIKGFQTLMDSMKEVTKERDFQEFFRWLGEQAGPAIVAFGKSVGNIFKGMMSLFMAFTPLANDMQNGLLSLTERFANWAAEMENDSEPFYQFVEYVRENVPVILNILGDLASVVMDIIIALAPLGSIALKAIGGLVDVVRTVVSEIKSAFSEFDPSDISGNFETMILNIFHVILGGIPRLLQLGSEMINKLAEGMGLSVPQLMMLPLQAIQGIITGFINALPMIIETGMQILEGLIQGILTMLPTLITQISTMVTTIIDTLTQILSANLPLLLQAGLMLLEGIITGIVNNLPLIIQSALNLITTISNSLIQNLPFIIDAGIKILFALIDGVIKMLPKLVQMAITLIIKLIDVITQNLPKILNAGVRILFALIDGLIKTIPTLVGAIPRIVAAIFNAFAKVDWLSIGRDIIRGIGRGISGAASSLFGTVEDIARGLLKRAKGILGIASPSKVFAKEVGRWIPAGVAEGIESKNNLVSSAISNLPFSPKMLDEGLSEINMNLMNRSLGNDVSRPPLSMGGLNLTINIDKPIIRSEQDIYSLAKQVSEIQYQIVTRRQRFV